jgi:hypothetical protein
MAARRRSASRGPFPARIRRAREAAMLTRVRMAELFCLGLVMGLVVVLLD